MKTLLPVISFAIAAISQGNIAAPVAAPVILQGKVVSQQSNASVQEAYIHITSGEEETITAKDGSFVIKTWQQLPVQCTIEHKDYVKKKITVTNNKNLLIVLQEK